MATVTPTISLSFEDVATGHRIAIDPNGKTAVKLSLVGKIPTIRADRNPAPLRMGFRLRHNGQPVAGIPDYPIQSDRNAPWRINGDKAAPLPVGESYVSVFPLDANDKPTDAGVTVKVTILPESPVTPTPTKPVDGDDTKPDAGDKTDPTPARKLLVGLHDAADRPYDAAIMPWVGGVAFWWSPQKTYARDDQFANVMTYVKAGKTAFIRVGLKPAVMADLLTWLPAWFAKATADMATVIPGDLNFEILNEPDQAAYFTGTLDQYVQLLRLIDAATPTAIRSRVKLFTAGFSWDISTLEKWAPRFAPYVEGFCFHGYPRTTDAAGMDPIKRFGALCVSLNKIGVLSEAAPQAKGIDPAAIAGRTTQYLAAVSATPGIVAAYWFAARAKGYTNGGGAAFTDDWQLTDSGRAIAGAVG